MEALDLKLRSGTGPGAGGRLAIEAMQFEKLDSTCDRHHTVHLPFLSGVVTVSVT